MSRKLYWLPITFIVAGTILILYALLNPRTDAEPAPSEAEGAGRLYEPTQIAQATPTPNKTTTAEANLIATNQQFFIPTSTDAEPAPSGAEGVGRLSPTSTTPSQGTAAIHENTPFGTPIAPQTIEPGTVVSYTPSPTPTNTPVRPTNTPGPSPTPSRTPIPTVANTGIGAQINPPGYLARFGISGQMGTATNAAIAGLPFGSYLTWGTSTNPARPNGAQFWQMVRVGPGGLKLPSYARVDEVIVAQPGAIWVIGNEPDVIVQDNVNPERYAEVYHDLYHYIKARDPSAQIAIAGVAQPTPLRRAYLDRVLNHYQNTYGTPMPIDIWTVHGFIFREEAGGWGAGIPPGMGVTQGTLYNLEDHANLDIFRQNLLDFRLWMAGHGYQETPLAVTEYGVVMPAEYGFPPELVEEFLVGSFNFFLSANNGTGWSADGGRLFQFWFWFSVHDEFFVTPNLYDPVNNILTPLGNRFAQYVHG